MCITELFTNLPIVLSQLKFAIFKLAFWDWFIFEPWESKVKGQIFLEIFGMSKVMAGKDHEKSLTFGQAWNVDLKMTNLSWDLFYHV